MWWGWANIIKRFTAFFDNTTSSFYDAQTVWLVRTMKLVLACLFACLLLKYIYKASITSIHFQAAAAADDYNLQHFQSFMNGLISKTYQMYINYTAYWRSCNGESLKQQQQYVENDFWLKLICLMFTTKMIY